MEDTRITFETAKLAKEKGFNALCYDAFNSKGNLYSNGWCEYLYDNEVGVPFSSDVLESQDILRPTQSLLAKWLREEHNIHVTSKYDIVLEKGYGYTLYFFMKDRGSFVNKELISYMYKTYEEALEAGLQEALKLINNK